MKSAEREHSRQRESMCEGLEVGESMQWSENREKVRVLDLECRGVGYCRRLRLGRWFAQALPWGSPQLV